MKCLNNDVLTCFYNEKLELYASIVKFSALIRSNPVLLEPFRGGNRKIEDHCTAEGFQVLPTVKKTTLLYDPVSDCFFKILHPLSLKKKISYAIKDRSKAIYETVEFLLRKGVNIQRIEVYGLLKKGRKPFFGVKKAAGESLYETLIVKGRRISKSESRGVIDEVVRMHALGYWFGDSHLSHFFMEDGRVTGIIDAEGIRKNHHYGLKNRAKDIAGLNHPHLPFSKEEMMDLLDYYLTSAGITQKKQFKKYVQYYTDRRWKE